MSPLKLSEFEGAHSLVMGVCDVESADEVVESLGHTPNGYFWQDIATLLLEGPLSVHASAIEMDSEGDNFVAYSPERSGLEALGEALAALLADPPRLRAMIQTAIDDGFEFDD